MSLAGDDPLEQGDALRVHVVGGLVEQRYIHRRGDTGPDLEQLQLAARQFRQPAIEQRLQGRWQGTGIAGGQRQEFATRQRNVAERQRAAF
jgi:hypothetical protein